MFKNKFIIGLFILICVQTISAQPPNNKRVVGYFTQWSIYAREYQIKDIPAEKLSHILYAFFEPKYDPIKDIGWIESLDPYADFEHTKNGSGWGFGNIGALQILKQRNPHLKVSISIGGWTKSQAFPDIAKSANARRTFANSCNELITNYGLDGIDIDWNSQ